MLIRGYYLVIIIQQCNCFRGVMYFCNVCKRYLRAKINLIFVQRAKYMVESLTTLHNILIVLQFRILLSFFFFLFFQDEIVAVSEKAVLRVSDLLDWIASPKEIQWDRGLKGVCEADCKPLPGSEANEHQYDKGLNAKFSPGHSEFLSDVRAEKDSIGM